MATRHPFLPTFSKLPTLLPVFPLPEAVLLPHANLPLTIFEPRYLNMVEDAMRSNQLIGMIQPSDNAEPPTLYAVGCAGRITHYVERQNGQLEIVLTGTCRFKVAHEVDPVNGYRRVTPDWTEFADDIRSPESDAIAADHLALFRAALHRYLENNQMQADWQLLDKLSGESLMASLIGLLPLGTANKQMLLEAQNNTNRIIAFTAILSAQDDEPKSRQ
ncbi:ATP-dependent protease [Arenicella chitinivorans]|uniref:ATP-dependent protease n=1 Tax=Arenicella chitinivorans TaxID=1329800 RepID=A0A918VP63_9GAMM|nr:LON peptidase substrate-binding domain-containing protein [Arenicella chitinivorans]GHA12085.1 ATP-dependent protease [Arenicella chitinivorans]